MIKYSNLFIGTSGYDYPEWKGLFYPETLARKDYLSWYATIFNSVELNFSFYRMPSSNNMQEMINRSDGKLLFSVKAHQSFTHKMINTSSITNTFPLSNWKDGAKEFITSLNPLIQKNLLSSILFQFPQSFHYTKENRIYLSNLLNEFNSLPLAVELRQAEWHKESVSDELLKRNIPLVFCDEPDFTKEKSSTLSDYSHIPPPSLSTLERIEGNIYMRFHGRNKDDWYCSDTKSNTQNSTSHNKNGSARYVYNYDYKELSPYISVIHNKIESGRKVQIYFNNHPKAAAAKNAKLVADMVNGNT